MNHSPPAPYAARLDVDYPEALNRLTTCFRLVMAIPIVVIARLIFSPEIELNNGDAEQTAILVWGVAGGGSLPLATALMIIFRRRYPRWWFDFAREGARFGGRVYAYLVLVTDQYPSTVDEQAVHLEIDYPIVERDLNRWLPLIKWILALPHYIVLLFLYLLTVPVLVIAWFSILITGRYPRVLFDFVVGVWRWTLRVGAYVALLVTDEYPPFALD
ncbi:MAG: DUF4389 domain-containing protein [Bryobacterales bacterium]|nr:DUF4389 domain-containing protein [Bryobacterales bacterium]